MKITETNMSYAEFLSLLTKHKDFDVNCDSIDSKADEALTISIRVTIIITFDVSGTLSVEQIAHRGDDSIIHK